MTAEEFDNRLKAMDRQIKRQVAAAKKLPALAAKVQAQRDIAALRQARFDFQLSYFEIVKQSLVFMSNNSYSEPER